MIFVVEMKKIQDGEWQSYLSNHVPEDEQNQAPSNSPPFVRAPLEDRSKYEKLTFNVEDISSDDSDETVHGKC